MNVDSSPLPNPMNRGERLRQVLQDVIQRRARGVEVSDEVLIARHRDLLPELAIELNKLHHIHAAMERAEGVQFARALDRLQSSSSEICSSNQSTSEQFDSSSTEDADEVPSGMGRYDFQQLLGKGGFGHVYLARDLELGRYVAIKLPNRKRLRDSQAVDHFLAEARALAALDHPAIVPVYDMGRLPEGGCYIVSKWIEGSNLALRIRTNPLALTEVLRIMIRITDALAYAHARGIVHRDLKPANILIDQSGNPFLVDFGGLAPSDHVDRADYFVGTPAYMSPEQARAETHRIDGRSDIFSLGIVFYEMLTGIRPFQASSHEEMVRQIVEKEVIAPGLINASISAEIDRICLKALSKRAADRYQTAQDFLDDLSHGLKTELAISQADITAEPVETAVQRRIVPKGLRAFDAHDADFFLELLPGPRDRTGLPESIRQWKTRIEAVDADESFSVGLLYGRSGCGKSSFVRAGLLPRLSPRVQSIYIEATGDGTEEQLLRKLAHRFPDRQYENLAECLADLRRGTGLVANQKILLVIDQFEQYLHGKNTAERRSLVQALRHCDGHHLQCLLLVRDDFWLAISRFMDELEIELVQGRNTALVDLFDPQHARKVLFEFGKAFSRLPDNPAELHPAESLFLDRAIEGLSEADEGKVISVRLALFAEMVKGRTWNLTTLDEIGGAEGVGATFLEEMFCSRSANPQHRLHERGARAVLEALLPDPTSDIKGHIRSYPELLDISGYGNNPRAFKELMRILDSETRLLTPTESPVEASVTPGLPPVRYYQLTHDYLVPSLRAWLTTKQKLTLSGRAELRLNERAKLWMAHPESRQLPTLWEWMAIRVLTRSANWTASQRRMMHFALRRQGGFAISMAAVVLAFLIVGAEATTLAKDALVWFRINTAPAWLALGQEQTIWPLLESDPDPTLRTRLIHRLRSLFIDPNELLARQAEEEDVSIRRALLLAAGESIQASVQANLSTAGNAREKASPKFIQQLVDLYQNDVDPGIHGAAEWTLVRLEKHEEIARANSVLQTSQRRGDRQWYLSPHGHTMVVIPGPAQYLMGSPNDEQGRRKDERMHAVHVRNSFSIASRETTVDQFQRFTRDNPLFAQTNRPMFESPNSPQSMINWYQAAAYCNWLSKEDRIPESQWCYVPNAEGQYGPGMALAPDAGTRRGYRLPTEREWEYACRAGTTTSRYFGRTEAFAGEYLVNSANHAPQRSGTGLCKPNDFGLFDMLGNVAEWCQDPYRPDLRSALHSSEQNEDTNVDDTVPRVVRGGSLYDPMDLVRSASRAKYAANVADPSIGFRVAQNYP